MKIFSAAEPAWRRLEYDFGGIAYLFADAPVPALEAIRMAEALRQIDDDLVTLTTIVDGHYDAAYFPGPDGWQVRAPIERSRYTSRRRCGTVRA